jgi:hypothetical protein
VNSKNCYHVNSLENKDGDVESLARFVATFTASRARTAGKTVAAFSLRVAQDSDSSCTAVIECSHSATLEIVHVMVVASVISIINMITRTRLARLKFSRQIFDTTGNVTFVECCTATLRLGSTRNLEKVMHNGEQRHVSRGGPGELGTG